MTPHSLTIARYTIVEDSRAATFIISKQALPGSLGFGAKHPIGGGGICEDTQRFNHIPGQETMVEKASCITNLLTITTTTMIEINPFKPFQDQLAFNIRKWGPQNKPPVPVGLRPEEELIPLTFVLSNVDDCKAYVDLLRRGRHHGTIWMLKKVGMNNNEGISILMPVDLRTIIAHYALKKHCPWVGGEQAVKKMVVQKMIMDPMLIFGHKVDLRVFMFVASTNPLLAFYYPIFMTRRSSEIYGEHAGNVKNITSLLTAVANKPGLMNDKYALGKYQYTPDEFQQYLYEHGQAPHDYIEQYLQPGLQRLCSMALAAHVQNLDRGRGYYGIYGLDVMLEQDFSLKILEINFSPQLSNQGASSWKRRLNRALVEEVMHIEHAIIAIRAERGIDAHIGVNDLHDSVLNMQTIAEEQADGSTWWYHEHVNDRGKPPHYWKGLGKKKDSMTCKEEHRDEHEARVDKAHGLPVEV